MGSFTELDRLKDELQANYPGWRVWYVPRLGGTTWCAQPRPSLAADTAGELAAMIEQARPGEAQDGEGPEIVIPLPAGRDGGSESGSE